jgi:hypothetical protein
MNKTYFDRSRISSFIYDLPDDLRKAIERRGTPEPTLESKAPGSPYGAMAATSTIQRTL